MSSLVFKSKIPRAVAGLATLARPSTSAHSLTSTHSRLPLPIARSKRSAVVALPSATHKASLSHNSKKATSAVDRHVARLRACRSPVAPPASRVKPASSCKVRSKTGDFGRLVPARSTSKTSPLVLKSCIRKNATSAIAKAVRWSDDISRGFLEGWNGSQIRGYLTTDAPHLVRPLSDLNILPPQMSTTRRRLDSSTGMEWALPRQPKPNPKENIWVRHFCQPCRDKASLGSVLPTQYQPGGQTVLCSMCLENPEVRARFQPPLEENGDNDHLDRCSGDHTSRKCAANMIAYQLFQDWRDNMWPEDMFF